MTISFTTYIHYYNATVERIKFKLFNSNEDNSYTTKTIDKVIPIPHTYESNGTLSTIQNNKYDSYA